MNDTMIASLARMERASIDLASARTDYQDALKALTRATYDTDGEFRQLEVTREIGMSRLDELLRRRESGRAK